MKDFSKVCRLGTIDCGRRASVYVKIDYRDSQLSITGVEGPLSSGNALGGCGQINMRLRPSHFKRFAPGWTRGKVAKFLEVWDRWHLNDMNAGTPAQMEAVRNRETKLTKEHPEYKEAPHSIPPKLGYNSHFDMVCAWLKEDGLLVDNGYKYGSKWLRVEVPAEVLEFLAGLPDTDKQPAWV